MITLLTDFGVNDIYVGVMKGVIKAINPSVDIVDLTHNIPAQNISVASFLLANAVDYFPDDTIHLIVVDPTVGTARSAIALKFQQGYLVCPNNGIITDVLNRYKPLEIHQLDNPNYWGKNPISKTFHGRDIFAPVASYISKGIELGKLGKPLTEKDLVKLNLPELEEKETEIIGTIRYIDTYGNLITNIPESVLLKKSFYIKEGDITINFHPTYGDVKEGEIIALIGSHGYLEIAVNCGSAKIVLNKNYHDLITLKIHDK